MFYDLAYGPHNPRPHTLMPTREWEDPMEWVDILVDAAQQVADNVAANTKKLAAAA